MQEHVEEMKRSKLNLQKQKKWLDLTWGMAKLAPLKLQNTHDYNKHSINTKKVSTIVWNRSVRWKKGRSLHISTSMKLNMRKQRGRLVS